MTVNTVTQKSVVVSAVIIILCVALSIVAKASPQVTATIDFLGEESSGNTTYNTYLINCQPKENSGGTVVDLKIAYNDGTVGTLENQNCGAKVYIENTANGGIKSVTVSAIVSAPTTPVPTPAATFTVTPTPKAWATSTVTPTSAATPRVGNSSVYLPLITR
jgi:hypothetical protein